MIRAVLWDFGGVVLSSPFDAFNRYEAERGLPPDFIRSVNATNPHENAWARLERNELSHAQFDQAFRDEAIALGHDVPGADVLGLLAGDIRPEMVNALRLVKDAGYRMACLTNNVSGGDGTEGGFGDADDRSSRIAEIMSLFDEVLESSKVGCRKPEARFYELACERLAVEPSECVFLDDLGVNLKPAAAMGMTTIKVLSADQALTDLEAVLGMGLRS
ncbi:MAG: HAD-IA family hydrolase [Ilumatobacteraceae bacterium]